MEGLRVSTVKENGLVGRCVRKKAIVSQRQLITSLEAENGGFTWPTYSEILDYSVLTKEYKPTDTDTMSLFTAEPHIHAMILGTMLGDGSIANPEKYGYGKRIAIGHGEDQKEYAAAKMLMLSALRPSWYIGPNRGYGKGYNTFHFATTTSLAIEPYWSLCYSKPEVLPDGRVQMRKYVSQAWVDQLTWEAVAWWIQDDGCLGGAAYRICTMSFSEEEVDRLVAWFRNQGLKRPGEVQRKVIHKEETGKDYQMIVFSADASFKMAGKIAPYVHPSMAYKLEVMSPSTECVCQDCGVTFLATRQKYGVMKYYNAIRCPECAKKEKKNAKARYRERVGLTEMRRRWREEKRREEERLRQENPEKLEERRAKNRERYQQNKEQRRAYNKKYYQAHKEEICAKELARYHAKAELKRSGSSMTEK